MNISRALSSKRIAVLHFDFTGLGESEGDFSDGFRTELFANGFPLIADEPVEFGGGNEGPSPYEYLLAALGACTLRFTLHVAGYIEVALVKFSGL